MVVDRRVECLLMARAAVVLVNWNGWCDSIECLESLFRQLPADVQVIVCDNGSTDNSLDRLRAWAEGLLDVAVPGTHSLRHLSWPPVPKALKFVQYDRETAEQGGADDEDARLVLIDAKANLGFGGGNNVALRYLLAHGEFEYVWLLNNDTVVADGAFEALLRRMTQQPDAGICGATLLHYADPGKVQARGGGWYCRWLGLAWHLGQLGHADAVVDTATIERRMSYVVGASMLVSTRFLQQVGLMNEDYFLYFEELDWALRSKGKFSLAYASDCWVYHKVGRSVGSGFLPHRKSYLSDYYNIRNRLLFTSRYYPMATPMLLITLLCAILLRAVLGQWDRVAMVWRLILSDGTWEIPAGKVGE